VKFRTNIRRKLKYFCINQTNWNSRWQTWSVTQRSNCVTTSSRRTKTNIVFKRFVVGTRKSLTDSLHCKFYTLPKFKPKVTFAVQIKPLWKFMSLYRGSLLRDSLPEIGLQKNTVFKSWKQRYSVRCVQYMLKGAIPVQHYEFFENSIQSKRKKISFTYWIVVNLPCVWLTNT